jgi:beta-lactamase class A
MRPQPAPPTASRTARFLVLGSVLAAFCAGFLAGRGSFPWSRSQQPRVTQRDATRQYRFTSPLLDCDVSGFSDRQELRSFRGAVEKLLARKVAAREVIAASVYFRDLNNGPWFGIGENERFSPASLLKVPIMMAYFKWAESSPQVLEKRLVFPQVLNRPPQLVEPGERMQSGRQYSIQDFILHMIGFSDNDAAVVLAREIGPDRLDRVYRDLGLTPPGPAEPDYSITILDYATFLRVLYNSSYLTRRYSEAALGILTKTEFRNGLVAGVPSGVFVAHKFGEQSYGSEGKQLHDCGIVYYPNNPYLLCVMTRGRNMGKLADAVADVSRLAYAEVNRQLR